MHIYEKKSHWSNLHPGFENVLPNLHSAIVVGFQLADYDADYQCVYWDTFMNN